jgi:hypothetical protein
MKCKYCDFVPETHYKDGTAKTLKMQEYWLKSHLDNKHRAQYLETLRLQRRERAEANQQERTLRQWGENTPAMCECGLTVRECEHERFTLGIAPHRKTVDE